MAATNHGSIEYLKFPNPTYPGDESRMIKKWLRDSWSRRKIAELQYTVNTQAQTIATLQNDYTALAARVTALEGGSSS